MAIEVRSRRWRIRSATRATGPAAQQLPGLPREFLTDMSRISDEVVIEPAPATRAEGVAPGSLDVAVDVKRGHVAILAVRHPSGALTFHRLVESTTHVARRRSQARFVVSIPAASAARGLAVPPAAAIESPRSTARIARRRTAATGDEPAATPLRITVMNADLSFIPDALLLGHYGASELTGTEAVMNRLVGGTMAYSLQVGVYPLAPGTHQVFVNRYLDRERGTLVPRPAAVIVAGLGAEGALQAADLVKTIRLAVIGWAGRLSQERRPTRTFELASTLLASGGTGISAGQSAQLIAQAVLEANALLARDDGDATHVWPRCSHLRLVELFLDRAAEAWRALQLQQRVAGPDTFVLMPTVEVGKGGHLRPPDSGYRGAPYDFITVETKTSDRGVQTFEYTLDTRRARSEIRGKSAQTQLLNQLMSTASNAENRDPQIGVALANLLVPVDLEGYLASASGIQMSLDAISAAIPWELLDISRSRDADDRPWAVRVKLLRKLKLERFRERVVDANEDDNVLVIGEPECPTEYPRLEGARMEAVRVHEVLKGGGVDAAKLRLLAADTPAAPRPDAQSIVDALFEKPWRIVHIAGHGSPGANTTGGVVLSNGTFLSPDEIKSLRVVPELVFVNCCYLGRIGGSPSAGYNRPQFAAGVAGALIDIGVRCVVAAGWAVDDDAASEFAAAFYDALLRGERFIDAIGAARQTTWDRHRGVNTWAAYQCYGDPDWRYQRRPADANRAADDAREFSWIATDEALRLELDRIFVTTRFQHADRAMQVSTLQMLEERFGGVWGHHGNVAESFGRAYAEAGAMDRAIAWYERAVGAADGSASMEAAAQLGNAQSRFAWELVEKALRYRDKMRGQVEAGGAAKPAPTRKARGAARAALVDAERRVASAIAAARPLLAASLNRLRPLAAHNPSLERQSLVGSTLKRRAMVNTAAGQPAQTRRDLVEMRAAYADAVRIGQSQKDADLYYPAANCLAADVVLGAGKRSVVLDRALVSVVKKQLEARAGASANFWSEATAIELRQYEAIAARRLAREFPRLKARYQQLFERATSIRMWASVYDNAYLLLAGYAQHGSTRERDAAMKLLTIVRGFAHPND